MSDQGKFTEAKVPKSVLLASVLMVSMVEMIELQLTIPLSAEAHCLRFEEIRKSLASGLECHLNLNRSN